MIYIISFAIILFSTLFIILFVNKFINNKLKIVVDTLLIILILCCLYYFYTNNPSVKKLHTAAFNYFSCEKEQLYDNECNKQLSKLAENKVEAEINNINKEVIEKTIKLSHLQANPELKESPYLKIETSLKQYPLFISSNEENFAMYDARLCQYIDKPLYQIVAWIIDPNTFTVYIAMKKQYDCPSKSQISKFPFVTYYQYKDLHDGFWEKPSNILFGFKLKIISVNNINFSVNDLKEMATNNDKKDINNKNLLFNSFIKSNPIDISDIKLLGSYGNDKIQLYKSNKSCFLSIYGRNNNNEKQGVIFWNPKYPEWLVLYPNFTSTNDAVRFSRSNQPKLSKEISSNYVVVLGHFYYPTKGVFIDNELVKLANIPIDNLKQKLINEKYVIFYLPNSTYPYEKNFYFGLMGFEEAYIAYQDLCKNHF